MIHSTKQRLLDAGLEMLLKHGYNDLGIQALLDATDLPKGSFYHHFTSKESFTLAVLDAYMEQVHAGLDTCLNDPTRLPLDRIRHFFTMTEQKYRADGYMGCLIGGLGQELSGVNDRFRRKIEECFTGIASRIAVCLEEAQRKRQLPRKIDPSKMANLLVDCWEGAALRSRLKRTATPLERMLNFYFGTLSSSLDRRSRRSKQHSNTR